MSHQPLPPQHQSLVSNKYVHFSPWFTLLVPCLLAYGAGLMLRLVELPFWQVPFLRIGEEPLMATHDAYFWLAGAQGTSWAADEALMCLLRILHQVTGVPLGKIGFYLPVLLAPLAGLPLCYLAWKQRIPEAGIGAALLGTGCLGYFLRTRPGFCDTDPLALFVPALMGTALILWISPLVRSSWLITRKETSAVSSSQEHTFVLLGIQGILLGLVCRTCFWLYPSSHPVILAFLGTCGAVALLLARQGERCHVLFALLCFHATAFGGWMGLGGALMLTALFQVVPAFRGSSLKTWLLLALFGLIMFVVTDLHSQVWNIVSRLLYLAKTSKADSLANGTNVLLPVVQQSIREAQNVDMANLYSRISHNGPLFWIGLVAFGYLVVKQPLFVTFAPILVLSVFSFKLGNRFTMYGGMVWGVGLCFGLSLFLKALAMNGWKRLAAQVLLCAVIIWPILKVARAIQPAPILPKMYAQTFRDLAKQTPPCARLWQWWDYGYAAQYYAKRMSFGDGANHEGPWLYPLALVHSTDSPAQAARMIRFITTEQHKTFDASENPSSQEILDWSVPWYNAPPTTGLTDLASPKAQALVDQMRTMPYVGNGPLPPQYFVVSWENLQLASWISYFGNWNLVTGTTEPGRIQRLQGNIQVNTRSGLLISARQTIPIDTLDLITQEGSRKMAWPNGKGLHGILNHLSHEIYVMDSRMYQSMMVQMLIRPPEAFAPFFEMVVDHYPWARAYKVADVS